jgi:hypothetical protein
MWITTVPPLPADVPVADAIEEQLADLDVVKEDADAAPFEKLFDPPPESGPLLKPVMLNFTE